LEADLSRDDYLRTQLATSRVELIEAKAEILRLQRSIDSSPPSFNAALPEAGRLESDRKH
jgi:hypothetical protein